MLDLSTPMTRMRPTTGCIAAGVGARVGFAYTVSDGRTAKPEITAGGWAKLHTGGPF